MIDRTKDIEALSGQYDRDGVVIVPGLFSATDVDAIRDALARVERESLHAMPASDYVLESDGASIRNLWRLERHSAFFDELSRRAPLLDLVRPLVHGDPVVMGVESFNKPPLVGSPVPPHQDNAYFCLRPADALTLWIAIDPVTAANGPVHYLKASHCDGVRVHVPSGINGNSMGLRDDLGDHEPCAVLLAPGDAAIHHCQTIHYSAPNKSPSPRCALLIVYRGAHCETDETLRAKYAMAQ